MNSFIGIYPDFLVLLGQITLLLPLSTTFILDGDLFANTSFTALRNMFAVELSAIELFIPAHLINYINDLDGSGELTVFLVRLKLFCFSKQ